MQNGRNTKIIKYAVCARRIPS